MKLIYSILLCMSFHLHVCFGQQLIAGEYGVGLTLAYDNETNRVTGYFENYTGWDESAKAPRFSCIFYLEGILKNDSVKIKTFYPADKSEDMIDGLMRLVDNKTVALTLLEDHGGCWNVQRFKDEPVTFYIEKQKPWQQIRYVTSAKSYFYADQSIHKKLKSYLTKHTIVCIEQLEKEWAYCIFEGKKTIKGWIHLSDLNVLEK